MSRAMREGPPNAGTDGQGVQRTSARRRCFLTALDYPFDRLLDWIFGESASQDKGLRLAVVTLFFLVSIPFAAFIIPSMVTTGVTKSAEGIIVHKGPYRRNSHVCEIDILYDKSQSIRDIDFTLENKGYCGPDFDVGSKVRFEYKTNLFGKAVLGPHPIVRPISRQSLAPENPLDEPDPPWRPLFLPKAGATPFHQGSGANRP